MGGAFYKEWAAILKYLQHQWPNAICRKSLVFKKLVTFAILILAIPQTAFASGESIGSISHIHNVKVFGKKIFLGTHEGLYQYIDPDTVLRVSPEAFDVMGLTIDGRRIYASGHPGPGSKLPQPVGLLLSTNSGKSWKKVSLQGKVDFHQLESLGSQLYGADSQSGDLMYSKNYGKSWTVLGKNTYSEIAISPDTKAKALALQDGKLFQTTNNFKSSSEIKSDVRLSQLEWSKKQLLAASGRDLLISKDQGVQWSKLYSFKGDISILAHSAELLVAIVGADVWQSADGGKSFSLIK